MAELYEFEAILQRMLNRAPNGMDRREGSILYDALAPTAYALGAQNYMLGNLTNLLFGDTAEGEWLDRVVHDFGLAREQATRAVRKISCVDANGAPVAVTAGKRFAVNELTFVVKAQISAGVYEAECEQTGTRGNCYAGAVLVLDRIVGLGAALLDEAPLILARDVESDEALRERFYLSVRQTPFGGNKADYRERVLSIEGVGACVVFGAPDLPEGAGNVGLVIGNEQGKTATDLLVQKVREVFGERGEGMAPVGHTVTVKTAASMTVNVAAPVRLQYGTSFETVRPLVEAAIRSYMEQIPFDAATVFHAKLVAEILLSHPAILDVGKVTLNGVEGNLTLVKSFAGYQIPALGALAVSEVVG